MHFISKLSIAASITAAALTQAQPLNRFGYRDDSIRPNGGNAHATGQYPAGPPPAMSILPVSSDVDPIDTPSSSPSTASSVTPTYGPPSVTDAFPTGSPTDDSDPTTDVVPTYGPPSVTDAFPTGSPTEDSDPTTDVVPTYGPPSVTDAFPTGSPDDPDTTTDVIPTYGPPSVTDAFPTSVPVDYSLPASSETGPRTVTVRPLPVSSGSSANPIQTISTSDSQATPTYGPPLVTGGFPTIPADNPGPISSKTATVTYTLGTGTETLVVTRTVTIGVPPQHQYPTTPPDAGVDPVSDSTTTVSTTSTTTTTITLAPSPSPPGTSKPSKPNMPGRPGGPPCKPAATVTVTEKETVTVTSTPTAVDPTFENPKPTEPVTPRPYPTTPNDDGDDDDVPSALPSTPSVSVPIKVPRPPYPTGTTVRAKPTASSGFFTRVLPMPTGGYYY
ncbi:hypothetical protein EMPG_11536 [Blastomyces silverae]|uniref:Uncharacterized protein n=1 Tax=Blastomyces silverae TaxID=2060906 RepID=A0A0H1BR94_9EURO|nr:hypothetical protein EMPG_11536 [Blastomyces silverae]